MSAHAEGQPAQARATVSPDATTEKLYRIQDRTVQFPVEVRDASSGSASFLVDAKAARRLVPEAF